MTTNLETDEERALFEELLTLRNQMLSSVENTPLSVTEVHESFSQSAQNLVHYLSLRRFDLRSLQARLSAMGLSSLGGSEPSVLSSLDRLLYQLSRLTELPFELSQPPLSPLQGEQKLRENSEALLGPVKPGRNVRIMVTMPTEAASDGRIIHELLRQGMDCMRINCAHDGPEQWQAMINHLRQAQRTLKAHCRIAMDLAGPKLRTAAMSAGPRVVRIKPVRDESGRVVYPARIWLSDLIEDGSDIPGEAQFKVNGQWLRKLNVHDTIQLIDARDSKRTWAVVDVTERGAWLESSKTTYVSEGLKLTHTKSKSIANVSGVPEKERGLLLQCGDVLKLTTSQAPGTPALFDARGRPLRLATIGCTLPDALKQVKLGHSVWFDDGKIGGEVEHLAHDHIRVKITQVRPGGRYLRADKGINFPDTTLEVDALTNKDKEDLNFVAQHADIVALSFVNRSEDVENLKQNIKKINERKPGIILKIETRQAFQNLPELLMAAMGWPSCGVMIARGDLAVECGFERMAEIQEEILWLSEAAHVPVIWATQVLESLAKTGQASRAEISDAAMGNRAECVMLNKGPHIEHAVRVLDSILQRMQYHQHKKKPMLRRLKVASDLYEAEID